MGIIVKNGILYTGGSGGDDAFRYVNDENDENYGWVQCQLADGTWVNLEYLKMGDLYVNGYNGGKFETYAGSEYNIYDYTCFEPMVTFGDSMVVSLDTIYQSTYGNGCVISKKIDLTKYSKITFDYECNSGVKESTFGVRFFISTIKQPIMVNNRVVTKVLLDNALTSSGSAEIDISSIMGDHYLGFGLTCRASGCNFTISNMRME